MALASFRRPRPRRASGPAASGRALLLLLLACASPGPALRSAPDPVAADLARERARGWAPPTPEDNALYRSLGHRIEALHLNALALRRLHAAQLEEQLADHALLIRRPGRGKITRPIDAASNPAEAHALEPGLGVRRLPPFVDNSALPSFPPLFDQGGLESCTAVVSTYYQLTHTVGLMRGWDQSRLDARHRFSPAWTYNLTNNGENSGVSLVRAYAALAAHGAVTLADFPYRGSATPAANYRRWPAEPALWLQALEQRIDRFGLVDARDPALFLRELKRLLLNGHVLTASTAIDGWNQRSVAVPPDSEGPIRHAGESVCTRVAPDSPVNHAITIVGYDDDIWVDLDGDRRVGPGERGAFKIANSWGRGDWNRGYRWLHYAAVVRPPDAPDTGPGWRGAFWQDRVFWLVPHRFYQPARVLEVELAPALRHEIRLAAGSAPFASGPAEAIFDRVEAPNIVFAQNGGPFAFDGGRKPASRLLRLPLDLTPALLADDPPRPALYLRLRHPAGPGALRAATILDPLTGSREPLPLGPADRSGTRWAEAPAAPARAEGPEVLGLPGSVAIEPGQSARLDFEIRARGGAARPVRVVALTTHAVTLADQDLRLTSEGGGRHRLEIFPRPGARGSALVLVHATDGWTRSTTPLRVNLQNGANTAPTLSLGAVRREGEDHIVPLTLADFETPPEKLTVFFDTPQIEAVTDFALQGAGSRRELRLRLRPGSRADLLVSAFDGELIGEASVSLRAEE